MISQPNVVWLLEILWVFELIDDEEHNALVFKLRDYFGVDYD